MATSEARITANQQNASKSTGPRTAEGKAASRVNAFRHGLAGAGDLLMPGEDEARVATRALAFGRELGATGEVGAMLARRAAVLSIRIEGSARRDFVAVAANVAAAAERFDRDRLDEIEGWIADLDGDNPHAALAGLRQCPEGLDHLVRAWGEATEAILSGNPAAAEAARRRVGPWLGPEADGADSGQFVALIHDELARLSAGARSLGDYDRAVMLARAEAGQMAIFDTSAEAEAARRHEAAAERGMYRAMHAITDLRRERDRVGASPAASILDHASPARSAKLPTPPGPSPRTTQLLASFQIGGSTTFATLPNTSIMPPDTLYSDSDRRKKRPDISKRVARRR